jgi:Alginate export
MERSNENSIKQTFIKKVAPLSAILSVIVTLSLLFFSVASMAQIHAIDTTKGYEKKLEVNSSTQVRAYKQLRYEEDYEFLKENANYSDYLDGIKYIGIGKSSSYLSVGGEARFFFEHYGNERWGDEGVSNNDYFLQRYMLHADLKLGKHFRLFTQLKSGLADGRTGGPRPVDVDKLDFNQLFIDIDFIDRNQTTSLTKLSLRVGRQELDLGAGRMISIRELPNVRFALDGFRATASWKNWNVNAFAMRPASTKAGYFDDSTDESTGLWGTYAVHHLANDLNIDLYYIGNSREIAPYTHGVGKEERHSVGSRLWYAKNKWSWDGEGVYQFGTFGNGNVEAWGISSRISYTLSNKGWKPKAAVNFGINSGDTGKDTNNQTFYAPFPNGSYFGAAGALGVGNVAGFAPKFSVSPSKKLFIDAYCYFFWRQSTADGIYNVPGFPNKTGALSNANYIGTQPELDVVWRIDQHQSLVLVYANFFAGKFIQETPQSQNITVLSSWYTYKF